MMQMQINRYDDVSSLNDKSVDDITIVSCIVNVFNVILLGVLFIILSTESH